jgi:hypothetical protein
MQALHERRVSPKRHHRHVDSPLHAHVDMSRMHERHQEIDGNRSARRFLADLVDRRVEHRWRTRADRAQPTGLRDRCG